MADHAKPEPKAGKEPAKPETKKQDFGPDFRYLVRLVNTDLDGKKPVAVALTYVPGVSHRLASIVARDAGVNPTGRLGDLNEGQIAKLLEVLESIDERVPEWMRNRQHDPETGEDWHMVGSEIQIMLREDLNRLKKIRSWRGHRHERKLPVRGQRTKNNGRFGPAVGVMRKDVAGAPAEGGAAAPAAAAGAPAAAAPKAAAAPAKPAAPAAAKPAAPKEAKK